MTREDIKKAMRDTKKEVVLKNLHKLLSLVEGYPEYEDCVGYAIEKLEQECIDYKAQYEEFSKKADIVISQLRADRNRLLEIFDNIRAKIEQLPTTKCAETCRIYIDANDFKQTVLEIIDKYKSESEDKE